MARASLVLSDLEHHQTALRLAGGRACAGPVCALPGPGRGFWGRLCAGRVHAPPHPARGVCTATVESVNTLAIPTAGSVLWLKGGENLKHSPCSRCLHLGHGAVLGAACLGLAKSHALSPRRAGEGAAPEAQEGLHREDGGNPKPVEKHRGPVCELVSHGGHT